MVPSSCLIPFTKLDANVCLKPCKPFFSIPAATRIDFTYTIQLTEAQYATLLDRAAELEIPLEDLLLQAMQNYLEESDNFA